MDFIQLKSALCFPRFGVSAFWRFGVSAVGVFCVFCGCASDQMYPTMGDVKEFARGGREELSAHDDNMTQQHALSHPEVGPEIAAQRQVFLAELEQIGQRTDALQSQQAQFIKDLAQQAGGVLANQLGLDSLTPKVGKVENYADVLGDEVGEVGNEVKLVAHDVLDVAADVREVVADTGLLEAKLAQLSADTLAKLANLDGQVIARLEAARANDQEFFRILKEDAGIDAADLPAMTTEEILALLASIGLGGVGLARTFGKSRAGPELDELFDKVEALKTDAALHKTPPATG